MAKGTAQGRDRQYQVVARELIQLARADVGFEPCEGDGIDVPFENVAGTTVTFDVALKSPDGTQLLVAECKRWADPVHQGALFEFASEVERLPLATGLEVVAVFVAKGGYQSGAERVALNPKGLRIEIATYEQETIVPSFGMVFRRYHPLSLRGEARRYVEHQTVSLRPPATLARSVKHVRRLGSAPLGGSPWAR